MCGFRCRCGCLTFRRLLHYWVRLRMESTSMKLLKIYPNLHSYSGRTNLPVSKSGEVIYTHANCSTPQSRAGMRLVRPTLLNTVGSINRPCRRSSTPALSDAIHLMLPVRQWQDEVFGGPSWHCPVPEKDQNGGLCLCYSRWVHGGSSDRKNKLFWNLPVRSQGMGEAKSMHIS